jgi:amino acid transporter
MVKEKKHGVKPLNKMDVVMLAFGAMIGWAWVVQSGSWINTAGTLGAILAFLLGGIVVLFVGQVYAELTACVQGRGVLDFALRGSGRTVAFIATWALVIGYFSVCAFEAVALPNVVTYLFPNYQRVYLYSVAGSDIYLTWLAVGVGSSLVIATVNYIGVKTAAIVQTVLTIAIALCGIALISGGFFNGQPANLKPLFINGASGLISVLAMTPFMYVGFDVIPAASSEMRIPQKKVGQILVISVFLAAMWYILIIFGTSLGLSGEELAASNLATADAMKALYGGSDIASKLLICGGIAGILTSWNAFIMGGSRAVAAMAQEGMLPACLGKYHPKYKTPMNAIILLAVLNALAPLLGRKMMDWLVNAGGMATTMTYLLVSICFIKLRKKEPALPRPYPIRHWKFFGCGAITLCAVLLIMYMPGMPASLEWPFEWAIIIAWIVLGALLFVLAERSRS